MRAIVASLAAVFLMSTVMVVGQKETDIAGGNTPAPTSSESGCTAPSNGNLYKRAACAADCYSSFCSCIQRGYNTNTAPIVDTSEPNHMGGLGCLDYYWGSCDMLQSCTAELIECSKWKANSGCKSMLSLAVLGLAAAPDTDYNTSAPLQHSCEYTTCDIFNRTRSWRGAQVCSLTAGQVNATCINPAFFRGTLRIQADVYRLQWDSSYSTNLRTAVMNDLKAIFVGMTVELQSVTGQKFLTVEFSVNRRSSDTQLQAAMTFGQASRYWLYSTSNFFGATTGWDYFGPRINRIRSSQCFSNSRAIPYVAMSGTQLRIDVEGKNESGCTIGSFAAARSMKIVASQPGGVRDWEYDWSYRHLLHDAANSNAGTVNFAINSTDGSGLMTVHCAASDTTFDISLQTSTTSFFYGKVHCVKAYPGKDSNAPANVTAWVSTTDLGTASRTLLAAWTNAGAATNLALTSGVLGALPVEYFGTDFTAFQTRLNAVADGNEGLFVANSCSAVKNMTFAFAQRTAVVVLGGNYYGTGCSGTATEEAFAGVRGIVAEADVILADHTVDPTIMKRSEVQSATLGYPRADSESVRRVLERYQQYRLERQPAVCTQTTATSLPSRIEGYTGFEGSIYFNGVCDIVACGFNGMWSTAVASNNRSCTLPLLTSWFWNTVPVYLKKADGTVINTQTTMTYSYRSRYMYVSTWSGDNLGDMQARIYTNDQAPFCFQLRCLNQASPIPIIADMPKFGDQKCVTSYESYYWYTSWVYHWYTVYGWKRYFYGWATVQFTRPTAATAPAVCKAIAVQGTAGGDQIFSLTLPLDASQPRGTVEGAMGSESLISTPTDIVSVAPSADTAARNTWCRNWAAEDALDLAITPRVAEANDCFQCPARIISTMPWGLWRNWWWGRNYWWWPESQIGNMYTEACYDAYGRNIGNQPWYRRCCYDIRSRFVGAPLITEFPSIMRVSAGWAWPNWFEERIVYAIGETNPDKICCQNGNAATCAPFRDRRPVGHGTTAPYQARPQCALTWSPRPPAGWGRGDPYCTSYDGTGFECNFWGEALWTGCGSWKVHVTAVPVTGAAATIINGVAVHDGNDTVVVLRNATGGHNVTLNDAFIERDTDAAVLSVVFDENLQNNTLVRITSTGGHVVEIEITKSFIALSTTPNRTCLGKCFGLLGNCDGDASNDLVNYFGNVSVSVNATGAVIYDSIVKSYVVTNSSMSLFPGPISMPPVANSTANVTAFVPTFVTTAMLDACPAVCNREPGCCLDNEVAGAAFANDTVAALETIAVAANQTVPLVGYNWPPELVYPSRVAVLTGLNVTMVLNASDSDGLASFAIDLCTSASGSVTCTPLAVDNANKSSMRLRTQANSNMTGTIVAVDAKGKSTTGYFDIVALPPPALPTISVTFSFSIVGTGSWSSSEVYTLRSYFMADLARIVNTYYSTGAGSSASFQPATTTSSDFGVSGVNDQSTTDGTVQVDVTSYVTGTTQQEAQARADALSASTISLPAFEAELVRLVPDASLGTSTAVEGTASPSGGSTVGSGSGSTGGPHASSGVATTSFLAAIVATIAAVLLL